MAAQQNENENEFNFLVYENHTWGNYGQHSKTIKLIIDVDKKTQKALWELVSVKWIKEDSRKNIHRECYAREQDVLSMKGKILKVVHDYQSSSRRRIEVKYYLINDNGLEELNAETNVKIGEKYYDIIQLNGKQILINKDEVIVK